MTRFSRIVAGALVVVAVAFPVAGSTGAVATTAGHMMPMGENGCC